MPTKPTGPPSAPMLSGPPAAPLTPDERDIFGAEPAPLAPVVPLPAPEPLDDIADPPVPAAALAPAASTLPAGFGAHEALLHGFCQHLQAKMHAWMMDEHLALQRGMDATMASLRDCATKVFQVNEHAAYTLGEALTKLQQEGLTVIAPPYQAVLQVVTPAGYPLALTLTKATVPALVDELGRLEAWLTSSGYAPGTVQEVR